MLWEKIYLTAMVVFVSSIMGIRIIDKKYESILAGLVMVLLGAFGVLFVSLIGIIWG